MNTKELKNILLNASKGSANANAVAAFERLEIPTFRTENWKHTPIDKFLEQNWTKIGTSELSLSQLQELTGNLSFENRLVFVNGEYKAALSTIKSAGIKVNAGNTETSENVANYNVFNALNSAMAASGFSVSIEKNKTIEVPIHIVSVVTNTESAALVQLKNTIIAEENSEAEILLHTVSLNNDAAFINSVNEVTVKPNARLNISIVQQESAQTVSYYFWKIWQYQSSNFKANTFSLSGKLIRNEVTIDLVGEYCETHLYGFYNPKAGEHLDNYIHIHHHKPHCVSRQLYKGIADEKGTGVFLGKVYVDREAQKTNAFQSNKNILLHETAKVHSKPQLEIYADDVSCSHGSTTGQVNSEAIFYLQARGLSYKTAQKLLLGAFAKETTENIKNEAFKEYVEGLIENTL